MKWTEQQSGKKVVRFVDSGVRHNPPCSTKRCERRNARKNK